MNSHRIALYETKPKRVPVASLVTFAYNATQANCLRSPRPLRFQYLFDTPIFELENVDYAQLRLLETTRQLLEMSSFAALRTAPPRKATSSIISRYTLGAFVIDDL